MPGGEGRDLRAARADIRCGIRQGRPIVFAAAVAGDLPCDRGRGSSEFVGDRPSAVTGGDPTGNLFTLPGREMRCSPTTWERPDTAGFTQEPADLRDTLPEDRPVALSESPRRHISQIVFS